ncbi:alpha-amylase family glycosyl hydrolase, partial [Chloroflexota bacterium]
MSDLRIPIATYRLQLNKQFRFADASRLIPYLHRLGISDIYVSPILKARAGSMHGYDVTNPTRLNPELGTEADFEALTQGLKDSGMGLLLDIVPNHMAASPENPWWQEIQEKGTESPYIQFFDMDWLTFGEVGSESSGYRRFFDISDLVGIRIEDQDVFEAVHSLVLRLITEGKVTGLRIDHIDGLYDPSAYLLRLQQRIKQEAGGTGNEPGFYVVVEKILSGSETLPEEWAVSGTTGYDFAGADNALFLDGDGDEVKALDGIYSRFTGWDGKFADVVYEKKRLIMDELFPEEMEALGRYLAQLSVETGDKAAFSPEEATEALAELTACLPVYRTYIRTTEISARDRECLEHAFRGANWSAGGANDAGLDFLQRVLFLDFPATYAP